MIRYKCQMCGVDMESPQGMEGETEVCPNCKTPNWVPGKKNFRGKLNPLNKTEPQHNHKQLVAPKPKPSWMGYIGIFFILFSICLSVIAWGRSVGVGGGIANLDLMNQRTCLVIESEAMFIAGVIFVGLGNIERMLWKLNRQ